MAEWTTVRSRKSRGKRSVNFQVGDLTSEDADTRKAALETAIKRKIEAEKKALKIVEQLLEDDVSEDFLVECGTFIASAHYKDTVEERSIIQTCGYPICKKKLENVPKQKYKISTKTNKVYDITERKCFCSDFCFRASKYYEAQLPKSPIWIREEESPPEIKLLKEGKSGRTGVEIKLSEKRIKVKEIEKPAAMTNEFDPDSSNSDTDANNENEQPFVSSVTSGKGLNPGERVNTAQIGTVDNLENSINCNDQDHSLIDTTVKLQNCNLNDHELTSTLDSRSEHKSNSEVLNVSQRAVSKRGAEQLRKILRNSAQYQSALKDHPSPVSAKNNMLEVLTQTLNEWKTEDTLKYILGTNYVIELSVVKEAPPKSIDEFEDLDEDDLSEETNDHENSSLIVCENISKESLPFSGTSNTTKPLPDYAKIKEKTEVLQIRVKDFFKGHYILPEEAKYDQDDGNIARNNTDDNSWTPALPLIDSCSQQHIRKRIVLEKLRKVLPNILLPLQITYSDVAKELHNLVKTFRFTNKNITHTIPEWTVIAIVLLSVLLSSMPLYKDSQENPLYTQFVSNLLGELHFQTEDLETLKGRFASTYLLN